MVASKLYYVVAGANVGGNSRTELVSVNADGSGTQVVVSNFNASPIFSSELVIDAAANRYYSVVYGATAAKLLSGSLTNDVAPTVVKDYAITGPNDEVPLGLEIDTANHRLSLGYFEFNPNQYDPFLGTYGLDPAKQGIRNLSYDPVTGAVTDNGFGITQSTANLPSDAPPGSTFTGGNPQPFFSASDLARDGSTVFFVNAAVGEGTEQNALYRWDGASGTAIRMTTNAQFPINSTIDNNFNQTIDIPNGLINDVVVDGANDFVIFNTNDFKDYTASALWVLADNATNTAATKLNLGAGFSASHPNFLPGEMTYDAQSRLLYVASEESQKTGTDDDTIYVFQIGGTSAATATATFLRTIAPPTLSEYGNITGLALFNNVVPTLDLDASGAGTGFTASFTENGAGVAIADTDVAIADDDANLSSATITLTNRQAGDVLSVSGGLPPGISASAYDAGTGVLTLTGSATRASYQIALHQILFSNAGDDPSTVDRSITIAVADAFGGRGSATATVQVAALNDAPLAVDEAVALLQRTNRTGNVVTDAPVTDADNDTLSLTTIAFAGVPTTIGGNGSIIAGNHGSLTIETAGFYAYDADVEGTIAVGNSATDIFTYTASDGQESRQADLRFTVTGSDQGDGGANVFLLTGLGTSASGKGGNDTYTVDGANDQVIEAAGGGNDTLIAAASYVLAAGQEIETLAAASVGNAAINLTGNALGQVLAGNGGANVLNGLGGADRMTGRDGNDTYYADSVHDRVFENGGEGFDTVLASRDFALGAGQEIEVLRERGAGGFTLTGNEFKQSIYGGAGADTIIGGGETDQLIGGAGADRFVFRTAAEAARDNIRDFSRAQGDKIDLSQIATSAPGGDFHFVEGATRLSRDAGELIAITASNGSVLVQGDVDGDGRVDLLITVSPIALQAGDFIL